VKVGSEASRGRGLEWLGSFALALTIAFACRAFVIEPFRIPSESMLPTLWIGDHLFVNKFVYGARIPGLGWRLPALRDPERGEVVVFTVAKDGGDTHPADRRPDLPREDFVKRIVGLPGDRIDFVDGVVFVNGEPFRVQRRGEAFRDQTGRELERREVAFDRRTFEILDDPERGPRPGSYEVEPGRYFVLGDNRDWSMDSRVWGTVRRAELKGPAVLLYWSWDFTGAWLALLDPSTWWNAEVRWDRVGSPIR
jgi:signal peptidase I